MGAVELFPAPIFNTRTNVQSISNTNLAEFIYKNKNNLCPYFVDSMYKMAGLDLMYTSEEHIRIALDGASTDLDRYVQMCFNKGKILKVTHGNNKVPQHNSQKNLKNGKRR